MCWKLAEDAQPEITCPLTFNWFPFDTQHCYLVMSISPYKIKLVSRNIEELLVAYQQNTILEYKVHVLELPADKKKVEISQTERDMWEASGVPLPETHRYQAGLTFVLTRKWSKYIYLYYIPSALCVLVSLNSFFIKPQVVPGRMGLLVTMFLSLTTLLVGSVSQSPSAAEGVNALTAWMMIHYLFIITIIIAYSYQLCLIRFLSSKELSPEDNKLSFEATSDIIDKWCLLVLLLLYILFNAFYWPSCI